MKIKDYKLSLACILVSQVISGYAMAHTVSVDGVISSDLTLSGTSLLADVAHSFDAGTTTDLRGAADIQASVENAVSAGVQNFHDNSSMGALVENAVTGGVQNFRDGSHLFVGVDNAVSGGQQNFYDSSYIALSANITSNNVSFNMVDATTRLAMFGFKVTLGKLEGKGEIVNDSSRDGTLTIDTGKLGASTFDGVLADGNGSGKLNLIKQGTGEWIYNGDGSGMTGTTIVNGGQLTVNGDMSNSNMTVNIGGVLAGGGSVGAVDVKAGGMLGTEKVTDRLKVNGDLAFSRLSTFYVTAAADGKAGLTEVSGSAALNNGDVYIAAGAGNYAPDTRYTILTADGGISGHFQRVTTSLYFLDPTLIYNTNSVELQLKRNEKTIVSAANSPSAINAANSLGTHSQHLIDHLLTTDFDTAGDALEQLAGAASASRTAAMLASTRQVGTAMLKAMEQRASHGNGLQAALLRDDAPLLVSNEVPPAARGLQQAPAEGRVWLQALGSKGIFESDDDAGQLQQRSSGGLLGLDWPLGSDWHMGVLSGYSKTELDAGDYLSGTVKSYHLGSYAWHQYGPLATRLGFAYSGHDGNSKRQVKFDQFSDAPQGSYDASGQLGFVELAYQSANGLLLKEPFLNLSYQRYQRDGYVEKGGAAALRHDNQQQSNLSSTLGLRVASLRQLNNGIRLTPRGSAGWRRTFGDIDVAARQSFVSGGSAFDVYGSNLDRDRLMLEGGLDMGLGAAQTLGVGYTGEIGTNGRNHGWHGNWRMSF